MGKIYDFLVEWTINYVNNRDIISRKIEHIEKNKEGYDILVKFKDKEQFFIVKPFIKDINEITEKLANEKNISLIMFNSLKNFGIISNNWKKFTELKNFSIYFVNPFSQLDKKWIIYPYTHERISDSNSLEKGLKSMFEMVEPITEEQLKTRLT